MLVWFKDSETNNDVALNPKYVVAVFTATTEEHAGKTVINVVNGAIIVDGTVDEAVARINGSN
jgi:hypothetical protein